jgi:fatty-acyl-CoA synthase
MEPVLSYSSGPSERALIGETIGANLARTVAAHGTREAGVDVATGRRMTLRSLPRRSTTLPSDCSRVASRGRPDRHLVAERPGMDARQYATARLGAFGERQPGLPRA